MTLRIIISLVFLIGTLTIGLVLEKLLQEYLNQTANNVICIFVCSGLLRLFEKYESCK